MADYVVRLVGNDNLSSTVKQVKKELSDVGNVGGTAIDKIDKKFKRIIESSAPLKRQLKDLKNIMADMNLKGLNNTDEFTKIATAAGQIKDAMDDASEAMNRYSSDTFKLDATIQAFQGIAAVGSVAAGTMALFGSENKEAAETIQKVQGALAILNGVQAIANTLNENSVLMLRVKSAMMAVNTNATNGNTVATVANTVATKAWNTAKAIGKALLGDFSGLLLLGIAGLTAYAIATNKSTEAEKARNRELTAGEKAANNRAKTEQELSAKVANSAASQLAAYYALQKKWKECNGDVQKQQKFMSNYKDEIKKTGFAVDSLSDAENLFVKNTNAVVQAIQQRARAQAAYELMVEKIKSGLEKTNTKNVANGGYYVKATDKNLTKEERGELVKKGLATEVQGTFNGEAFVEYHATKDGLDYINQKRIKDAQKRNKQYRQAVQADTQKTVGELSDIYTDASNKEQSIMENAGLKTSSTVSKSGGGGGNTNNDKNDEVKAAANSIAAMQEAQKVIQENLEKGLYGFGTEAEKKAIQDYNDLADRIEKEKIRIGFEIDPEIKNAEEARNKAIKQVEEYFKENASTELPTPQISSFESAMGENPFDTSTLDGIENLMNFNDNLIDKLKETKSTLEELKQALKDAGLEGSEAFKQVEERLNSVDGSIIKVTANQTTLGESAKVINEQEEKKKQQIKTYEEIGDAAQNAAGMISSLASASEDTTFQTAAIIAEAIANVIQGYAVASAQAAETGNPWIWAAFSLAGLAQVASVIAQIHNLSGYAEGGIIGGGSRHGDTVLSRLNAGEMVLNTRQQSNLFKAIDNGTFNFDNQTNETPSIQFKIKGSDIYGSLKNYSKTVGKTGKITGIK